MGGVPDRPSTLGTPDPERMELWEAVRALPDKQRQSIAYHYLGGLPFALHLLPLAHVMHKSGKLQRCSRSD